VKGPKKYAPRKKKSCAYLDHSSLQDTGKKMKESKKKKGIKQKKLRRSVGGC